MVDNDCVQGAENHQRIVSLETEVRQNNLSICKELERIRNEHEKRDDALWKAIDDIRNRLIYRPTWPVLVVVSFLATLAGSCIVYIITTHG